jgi:hypothetical protein
VQEVQGASEVLGVSIAAFDESAQDTFKEAMARQASVLKKRVFIANITEATVTRRLLRSSIGPVLRNRAREPQLSLRATITRIASPRADAEYKSREPNDRLQLQPQTKSQSRALVTTKLEIAWILIIVAEEIMSVDAEETKDQKTERISTALAAAMAKPSFVTLLQTISEEHSNAEESAVWAAANVTAIVKAISAPIVSHSAFPTSMPTSGPSAFEDNVRLRPENFQTYAFFWAYTPYMTIFIVFACSFCAMGYVLWRFQLRAWHRDRERRAKLEKKKFLAAHEAFLLRKNTRFIGGSPIEGGSGPETRSRLQEVLAGLEEEKVRKEDLHRTFALEYGRSINAEGVEVTALDDTNNNTSASARASASRYVHTSTSLPPRTNASSSPTQAQQQQVANIFQRAASTPVQLGTPQRPGRASTECVQIKNASSLSASMRGDGGGSGTRLSPSVGATSLNASAFRREYVSPIAHYHQAGNTSPSGLPVMELWHSLQDPEEDGISYATSGSKRSRADSGVEKNNKKNYLYPFNATTTTTNNNNNKKKNNIKKNKNQNKNKIRTSIFTPGLRTTGTMNQLDPDPDHFQIHDVHGPSPPSDLDDETETDIDGVGLARSEPSPPPWKDTFKTFRK